MTKITYAVIASNDDEILASHKLTQDITDILLWGDLFEEQTLDEWKAMKGEEKCKKLIESGIDTSSIEFMHTGDLNKLIKNGTK